MPEEFSGESLFTDALLGQITGRPDWARVDRGQELAFELMKTTPEGQRAPMLCLIGWLEWLKGKSSFAARYFKFAMNDVPDFRLAFLLTELVSRGLIAPVNLNRDTAYRPPTLRPGPPCGGPGPSGVATWQAMCRIRH
ncbi:DUF4192 family protein [Pseudarthrobacter sp. S9]|uniref:DUF4192 family protein n=1 Tax=Pseudarthrobacter sp. S9 TaxID=3418421 RepID=UPI003D00C2D5